MNIHPETGAIRAWLDGERPDLTSHITSCTNCRSLSEEQRANVNFATNALAATEPLPQNIDAALDAARPTKAKVVPIAGRARPPRKLNRIVAAVAASLLVGGLAATPDGRAYATDFLDKFRSEQLAVVPVDFASVDPAALESLAQVADLKGLDDVAEPKQFTNLADAEALAGIKATPLKASDVPNGFTGPISILAQAPKTVRVEFADHAGVPQNIRNATLVLQVPGAVVQAAGTERPTVVRGDAGTLEVTVEGGPTLAEVREALLSLPELPDETVDALRAIENWETTLPLPLPTKQFVWEDTKVNGKSGIAFGDETGVASAIIWRDGNQFHGVGGMLPRSDAKRIAEAE